MKFIATHRITFTPASGEPAIYDVRLEADEDGHGPAYTREEWAASSRADWELTEDGWFFQGHVTPGGANGRVQVTALLSPEAECPESADKAGMSSPVRR